MGTERGADGKRETTERLLEESRELLRDLTDRLGGEEGSVVLDPEPDDGGDDDDEP